MKTNLNAHRDRRFNIYFVLVCMVIAIIVLACSCSPQRSGCYGTRGMSGYSYCPTYNELKSNKYDGCYAWLYCPSTGLMQVTDMNGSMVCRYKVSK
jgi:hypothetical protein